MIDNVLTVALKRTRDDANRFLREGAPSQEALAEDLRQIVRRIENALQRWNTEQ